MTTFLFLVQLLFIGTLIIPAYAQTERCNLLLNATSSNFTVIVTPEAYKANTAYTVKIDDDRNLTNSNNVTKYLLQALSPQNVSVGEWDVVDTDNCSSIDTAVLNATQKTANWTSPGSNVSSVEIRAYIIFADKYATFKTVPLNKGTLNSYKQEDRLIYFCRYCHRLHPPIHCHAESETTTAPPNTTPNSVPVVQSSSFFIAVIQLPLLLVTSKLLS
ncbi:placenta-expressed transcript 1 protein-like isoform X1 [Phalacrocorax aristotelis]|uniref:placenta-expressed transcript 1 protein-like isoform X1 n=1 Tax=Phalacrocorax aristotelis TaxID=126867 RepID=UPI003F4BCD56